MIWSSRGLVKSNKISFLLMVRTQASEWQEVWVWITFLAQCFPWHWWYYQDPIPDRMVEWVEGRKSPVRTLVESNQWFKNPYLLLPSQVLGIIRIGQGLIGSVSRYCDWARYQVMMLVDGLPMRQYYVVAMSVHCHLLVPVLINLLIFPGHKTPINNELYKLNTV